VSAAFPEAAYEAAVATYTAEAAAHERSAARLANVRFFVFLFLAAAAVAAYRGSVLAVAAVAAGIGAFVFLMRRHEAVLAAKCRAEALAAVNAAGLARVRDAWHGFPDTGAEFAEAAHRYTGDLDVFGPGSLYQFLGGGASVEGRRALAGLLAGADLLAARMAERQAAVREIGPAVAWRHEVLATARCGRLTEKQPEALIDWSLRTEAPLARWFDAAAWVAPPLTLALGGAAYFGAAGWGGFTAAVIVQVVLFLSQAKRSLAEGERIRKAAAVAEGYAPYLAALASRAPAAPALRAPYERVVSGGRPLGALAGLNGWLEVQRIGLVHIVLNALVLWDAHCLRYARRWRARHGAAVAGWLAAATELEGQVVTAALAYEFPAWSFPAAGGAGAMAAESLGHPLIPAASRVANPVALDHPGRVLIVTGSNMSGKSTYMRTVGVNLLLAYLGAPVCGRGVTVAPVRVYTSMRNVDSLEKRMSSFYAELARIKEVIDAAAGREALLFLFDEIFRGTNSVDRLAGAREVLRRLSAAGAAGVVTTHDLELAALAGEDARFQAGHFTERYEGGRIVFDFRFRPGVATSRNAVALMRLVGILPDA
jgi:hypothetical protein